MFIAVVPAPTSSLRQERHVFRNSGRHMALLRSARFPAEQSYRHLLLRSKERVQMDDNNFRAKSKGIITGMRESDCYTLARRWLILLLVVISLSLLTPIARATCLGETSLRLSFMRSPFGSVTDLNEL